MKTEIRMHANRIIHTKSTGTRIRQVLTMSAISVGLSIGTGVTTALAGGKNPSGHHHDDEHWAAPAEAVQRANPVTASEQSISNGKQIYRTNCASCHGATGEGDGPAGKALKPPAANLKVMVPQHTDGDLAWRIAEGRGAMPPWKGTLSENDIWDVVNYIKQFAGAEQAQGHGHGHDDKHHDDKHHDDKHMQDTQHGHK